MGQTIAVGNPFGSEIALTNLSAALQAHFFKKVWEYTTPADLAGAGSYTIDCSGLSPPTINMATKQYILVISGGVSVTSVTQFSCLSAASAGTIYGQTGSSTGINLTSLNGTHYYLNKSNNMIEQSSRTYLPLLLRGTGTDIMFIFNASPRTIAAGWKVEIYEATLL